MFEFVKEAFFVVMTLFNFNVLNVNSLECVSLKNQDCKARPKIIELNKNDPVFYPFQIKINKCSGSCNNIKNPYVN